MSNQGHEGQVVVQESIPYTRGIQVYGAASDLVKTVNALYPVQPAPTMYYRQEAPANADPVNQVASAVGDRIGSAELMVQSAAESL